MIRPGSIYWYLDIDVGLIRRVRIVRRFSGDLWTAETGRSFQRNITVDEGSLHRERADAVIVSCGGDPTKKYDVVM